jgi:undecaprenyl-diphosphatase
MSNFNTSLFEWIYQFTHRNFLLDNVGIFLAQYLPYLLIPGFIFFAFKKKDWRIRIVILADGILAVILARGIVTELIRFFYHRERPFVALNFIPLISESNYSFPSGHAAWFFALAVSVFFYDRKLGIWYFAFAVLNGIARVFVGVHWPLDIVGGAIVGVLAGAFIHRLIKPSIEKIVSQTSTAQS